PLRLARSGQPADSPAPAQTSPPPPLLRSLPVPLGLLREWRVGQCIRPLAEMSPPPPATTIQSILANGLQHGETRLLALVLGLPQQALVKQCSHSIHHLAPPFMKSSTGCLYRLQGAPSNEDREPLEEPLLRRI